MTFPNERFGRLKLVGTELVPLSELLLDSAFWGLLESELHVLAPSLSVEAEFDVAGAASIAKSDLESLEFPLEGANDFPNIVVNKFIGGSVGQISDKPDVLDRPGHTLFRKFHEL